jgi:addiction module RelE/StbE family toxin
VKRYSVQLSDAANEDIRAITFYIAHKLLSHQTALEHLDAIERALASLVTNPEIHPLVRDDYLAAIGYRWLSVKKYLLFYTIDYTKNEINISRVLHGRRNWATLLEP